MNLDLKAKRKTLLITIPSVALLICLILYLKGGRYVETDNAYVKADKIPISTQVSGAISKVFVHENQMVHAGQPLFQIDPNPFRIAVDKAQAKLMTVRTDLTALKASYYVKQAEISLYQTKLSFALKNQNRQNELAPKHFISASQVDDAAQSVALAQQQISALGKDLDRISAMLGGTISDDIEKHPNFLSAKADLDQAKLDLERATIKAPLPGQVSKTPQPGQFLTTGSTAMSLVVMNHLWIEANFTETDLTHVKAGQPVAIRVSTYPSERWKGVVDSVSPATGAEFSIIPAQNATGNWVKITQRVPVRIRLIPNDHQPQLLAGLSTNVEIDTGHHRRFLGLL